MKNDWRGFIFGALCASGIFIFVSYFNKSASESKVSNVDNDIIHNLRGVISNVFRESKVSNNKILFDHNDILKFEDGFSVVDDPALLSFIRQRWLVYPSQEPRISTEPEKHYSQVKQSQFVDKFLQSKQYGFFIECGAANGVALSNTLFFEKFRGWTGLLIEPNPSFYSNVVAKRKGSYAINSCLSTTNKTMKVYFDMNNLFGKITEKKAAQVQCFPLFSILQAIGVDTIDYFSLDVEGPELEILKTIPWNKIRINVLTIEYRILNPGIKVNQK